MSGEIESNPVIAVFGRRGKGKSTWIANYIYENRGSNRKYFICDWLHDKAFDGFHSAARFGSIDDYLMVADMIENDIIIFQGEIPFSDFFELCYTHGNCMCVFDEIDVACSPHNNPEWLYKILHYGRHYNIGLIGAARRPANVTRDFTSQASYIIIFGLREKNDIKYIEDNCGKEFAEAAQNLPRGAFLQWPLTEQEEREIL
jgi:hypothetical protein